MADEAIEESVVKVSPDLNNFRKKLIRDLKAATAGIKSTVSVKVRLTADPTGFATSVRTEIAKRPQLTTKVKLVADARGLQQSANAALRTRAVRRTGGEGGSGSGDEDDKKLYRRIRDNLELVQKAEEQSYNERFKRLRGSFLEAVLKAEHDAHREQARRDRQAIAEREKAEEDARRKQERLDDKANAKDLQRQKAANVAAEREAERARKLAERRSKTTVGSKVLKASEANGIIDLGGAGIRPTNLLRAAALALSPALLAVGSSAVLASSSVASLGAAGIGAAGALTALTVGFSRIRAVLTLRQQAREEQARATADSGAAAAAAEARAERVVAAERAVRDAVLAVAESRRSLVDAQRDAVFAEQDAVRARSAINQAYRDGARAVRDLREEVSDLLREERDGQLSVAEAQAELDDVNTNYWATDLEKRRAAMRLEQARERLSDDRRKRLDTQTELDKRLAAGPNKSPEVLDARRDAELAQRRADEANRRIVDLRRDITDANRRVADARADLAGARTKDTTSTTAAKTAADELKRKIAELSPAARRMYYFFDRNAKTFETLREKMETAVLPGFVDFLESIIRKGRDGTSTLDILADGAADAGESVSDAVGKFGKLAESDWFRADLRTINRENAKAFDNLGDAALKLVKPLAAITATAAPLFTKFSGYLLDVATKFAAFIERAENDGSLARWFRDAGTEMGKWADIARNLLNFLKDVFTASLPAGQDLVTRMGEATRQLALWSGSADGQKSMRDFFTFFQNIDYEKLRNTVGQLVTLFTTLKLFTIARNHPFYAVMGLLLSRDLAEAGDIMGKVSAALTKVLSWAVDHPTETAALITVLTLLKNAKNTEIGLRVLGLGAVASKFEGLAKVLGKTTPTMTVHAGVVNVIGAAGGLPGAPGAGGKTPPPVVPGGLPGGAKAPANVGNLGNLGRGAVFLAPVAITVNTAADGKAFGTPTAEQTANLPQQWWEKLLGIERKPANKPAAPAPAVPLGKYMQDPKTYFPRVLFDDTTAEAGRARAKAMRVEELSLVAARSAVEKYTNKLQANTASTKYAKDEIEKYLLRRKDSVGLYVDEISQTRGSAAAQTALAKENEKTRTTLINLLTQTGMTREEATKYAIANYDIGTTADKAKAASDRQAAAVREVRRQTQLTKTETDKYREAVDTMKVSIDKVTGNKIVSFKVEGQTQVFKNLETAMAYQNILRQGLDVTPASIREQKRIFEKNRAQGGPVYGPGTSTSDSIPARLSNGEFVQPTKTVRYYGTRFMEAVRQRQLPKHAVDGFAEGGQVGTRLPFTVDMSKTKTSFEAPGVIPGGGVASGDIDVARVAEATARNLQASNKQLVALIEAGLVESGLRNLSYGDRDSVGYLQQRASWGTKAQRMNVAYATRSFIRQAKRKDRRGQTPGQLAQAVQISAFPDRYDQREADAYAVINREAPRIMGISGNIPVAGFGAWPASPGAQRGNTGVWKRIVALARSSGFPVDVVSTYRNGDAKWHGSGRAVDFGGYNQDDLAQFFMARKASVLELIHRTRSADYGVKRGKDSPMPSQWPLHENHLHVAMAKGGLVARKYDTGGGLPPGYTLAFNGTGRTETVRTHTQEKQLATPGTQRLDRRDLALLASYLVTAMSGQQITMDGRKVAEVVRSYDYLPGSY